MTPDWLIDYLETQRVWSRTIFGPGLRTIGITEHIKKECVEVVAAPMDRAEWVDIIILAMDGYWRCGGTPETLPWDLREKQDINFKRAWPTPGPEHEPTEHLSAERPIYREGAD